MHRGSLVVFLAACALGCAASHSRGNHDASAVTSMDAAPARDAAAPLDAFHVPDAGRDAQPPVDAPMSVDGGGGVSLQLTFPSATFCHCHHGCAPGADASVGLQIDNGSSSALSVQVLDMWLVPSAGGTPIEFTSHGYIHVSGATLDNTVMVPAGGTRSVTVTGYADFSTDVPPDGTYTLSIDLSVDGAPVPLSGLPLAITASLACPGP